MKIYVFDEIYKNGLTNKMLYEEIYKKGYAKERIVADSAEPKSIAELWDCGLKKIQSASKGRDSVNNGIQRIQNYEIIIHPRCVNFLTEISNYCWEKDKFNKVTHNTPMLSFDDIFNSEEIEAFDERIKKTIKKPEYTLEPKMDGLSGSLIYEKGILVRGATRGDGVVGEDIISSKKLIDSVNNFFKQPKDSFKFLFKIAIGVLISIVFFSNIILKCLNDYYLIKI